MAERSSATYRGKAIPAYLYKLQPKSPEPDRQIRPTAVKRDCTGSICETAKAYLAPSCKAAPATRSHASVLSSSNDGKEGVSSAPKPASSAKEPPWRSRASVRAERSPTPPEEQDEPEECGLDDEHLEHEEDEAGDDVAPEEEGSDDERWGEVQNDIEANDDDQDDQVVLDEPLGSPSLGEAASGSDVDVDDQADDGPVPSDDHETHGDRENVHRQEAAEAVEGNLELKRVLSSRGAGESSAKTRRLANGAADPTSSSHGALVRQQLEKWNLKTDRAAKYVLKLATLDELSYLHRTRYAPSRGKKRTYIEQIYEAILRTRERAMPIPGSLDCVGAFLHRWKSNEGDERKLRALGHRNLRRLILRHDGSQPLGDAAEKIDGLDASEPHGDHSGDAAPDSPGPLTISRALRLELIDPFSDALVLGDANLTFSIGLAAHRKALFHTGLTIATTFEQLDTLRERYREIDDTVADLKKLAVEVIHDVDCTRLITYDRFKGKEGKFGSVYYNFPHAGVVNGFFDGHPFVRWRHANLMHLCFRALRSFVKEGGSVKVSSNSLAQGVRFSDIISAAQDNEFVHVETIPFLEWQLRDYRRSYGDRRDVHKRPEDGTVYNVQRANLDMVYCFRFAPSGKALESPAVVYPPAKLDMFMSDEGTLGKRVTLGRKRRVEELYSLFLSYVEGIHVG